MRGYGSGTLISGRKTGGAASPFTGAVGRGGGLEEPVRGAAPAASRPASATIRRFSSCLGGRGRARGDGSRHVRDRRPSPAGLRCAYPRPPRRSPAAGRSASTSRRNRNSAAGRPPVAVDISPVGSTSAGGLHQAAEVLLVQHLPGDRSTVRCNSVVNSARHQFEHHRPVLELGAQPRDGGQDARWSNRIGSPAPAGFSMGASRPSRRVSSISPAS